MTTRPELRHGTAYIKAAYLNVPRPAAEIPILTKLEPFVAEICGLDPNQLYHNIDKFLYGLPDSSGRPFCRHYRDALIEEGYIMSNMDNCLFHKITEEEITFLHCPVRRQYTHLLQQAPT